MASNQFAMASILEAMATNLRAMASNLIAMATVLEATAMFFPRGNALKFVEIRSSSNVYFLAHHGSKRSEKTHNGTCEDVVQKLAWGSLAMAGRNG